MTHPCRCSTFLLSSQLCMYFRQGTGDRGPSNMENTNLPEELIVQILLRLPVKSLLRFRSVCKSWLSLISDPHFAKSHFELAAAPTDKLLYLAAYASRSRSIDVEASLHDDSASVTVKLNFLVPTSNFIVKIMGSCRGFLLFDDYSNLFLWNPSTGVHKRLPPCTLNDSVTVFTFLYGFGYDPSTDDYLVVVASYDTSAADLVTQFEFFSLRANSWRIIEGTNLPYMNAADEPKAGWLLNGSIHWFAFRHDSSVHVIIAFDLIERGFSEIPLPDEFEFERDCQFCDLLVFGGCLRLCYTGYAEIAEMWVMEEYKVQSSWTKSIVVSMDEIPTEYFTPICSTKCGDIVGIDGSTGLVKCNGRGELLEHRTYCDDPHGCEVAVYTESLLSLPGDSGQAPEDDHQ